jgi:hypothetical protein
MHGGEARNDDCLDAVRQIEPAPVPQTSEQELLIEQRN